MIYVDYLQHSNQTHFRQDPPPGPRCMNESCEIMLHGQDRTCLQQIDDQSPFGELSRLPLNYKFNKIYIYGLRKEGGRV